MNDCLFCKIINGDIPSRTIYEDDVVKVFLDIDPSTNGDCLLIPKKHIVTIDEVDDELMIHMLDVIKDVKKLLKEKLDCDGLTISQNNEYGQEIKHFHIHLTPRYLKDGYIINSNKELLVDLDKTLEKLTN